MYIREPLLAKKLKIFNLKWKFKCISHFSIVNLAVRHDTLSPGSLLIAWWSYSNIDKVHTKRRSRHWRCSLKRGVLNIFTKLTGKPLSGLLCNKITCLRPTNLLRDSVLRDCNTGVFLKTLQNFKGHKLCKILKDIDFIRTTHGCFC